MQPFTRSFLLFIFIIHYAECTIGQQDDTLQRNGKASFYHDRFQGQETSSGDIYDQQDFTAAHKTLPFNTFVHVTNKQNNKTIVVRINDRGPFKRSRIIDLTRSAAQKIGMVPFGVVPVKIQVLDLLDLLPLNDSMLKENDYWDCFGNKKSPEGISVYIWKTEYWKHAFYMATDLLIDYQLDSVLVKTTGDVQHRFYYLLISGITTKNDAAKLIEKLRHDGFRNARVMK